MNWKTEKKIRDTLAECIEEAVNKICESPDLDLGTFFWPGSFAERMAEQVTQSIALMQESWEGRE